MQHKCHEANNYVDIHAICMIRIAPTFFGDPSVSQHDVTTLTIVDALGWLALGLFGIVCGS